MTSLVCSNTSGVIKISVGGDKKSGEKGICGFRGISLFLEPFKRTNLKLIVYCHVFLISQFSYLKTVFLDQHL